MFQIVNVISGVTTLCIDVVSWNADCIAGKLIY